MTDDEWTDWVEDLTEAMRDAAMREMLARGMGDRTEELRQRMRYHQLRKQRDEDLSLTTDAIVRSDLEAYKEKRKRKVAKNYKRLIRKGRGLL